MVPLKIDVCNDRPQPLHARPSLVLKDWSQDQPRIRPHRKPLVRAENVFLAAAAAATFAFFLFSLGFTLARSIQQSYVSQAMPQTIVISKTVARGDTLARLALRYGNPSTYILEREDQIARANHLSGNAPLLPGQHLQILVTNPPVIAQIIRASHHRLVASR